ncbi:MAG TPA: MG2 domain-containing protein [Thermoanaerobaculia bacterium]|nr:MG2 domain-containing protein [Thermoanaerobaculia bacterium]
MGHGAASTRVFAVLLLCLVMVPFRAATASSGEDVPSPAFAARWDEIEKLTVENKLAAAEEKANALRVDARAAGDEETWARALARAVQARMSLGKWEEAVLLLEEEARPAGTVHRVLYDLLVAQALEGYAYRWNTAQRTRVESQAAIPLEQRTRDQLGAASLAAFEDAWSVRDALGEIPVSRLDFYLTPSYYASAFQGTLRDSLTYRFVARLADRFFWPPAEAEEGMARPDLPALIRGEAPEGNVATDPGAHPLVKLGAVLADLEAWHRAAGRQEAVLETWLERSRRLYAEFPAADRALILRALEQRLPDFRHLPWWSMGMATLAELQRTEKEPDRLVRAHTAAVAGRDAWPESPGGQLCDVLVRQIEAQELRLKIQGAAGLGRRSLKVTYRNLSALYFRAYSVDAREAVEERHGLSSLPLEEVRDLLQKAQPVAAWRTDLPATADFETRVTRVAPPLDRPGAYVILASAQEGFGLDKNLVQAVALTLGDLALVAAEVAPGRLEVRAFSARNGEPVAGAEVRLYSWERDDSAATLKGVETTGPDGTVHFSSGPGGRPAAALAEKDGEVALAGRLYLPYSSKAPEDETSALVYTDRAVYRPGQTIHWKVLACRGRRVQGRLATVENQPVTVELHDANNQVVAQRTATTGGFGTVAGEFPIPPGRLLGTWSLAAHAGLAGDGWGYAQVRVEEYKRPTFEVALNVPVMPLRLGRPAELTGKALYYYGAAVPAGEVRWKVVRSPEPNWKDYRPGRRYSSPREVAAGSSPLAVDGTFRIAFTPAADASDEGDLVYTFQVSAEVTNDGGETGTAGHTFRAGAATVEAAIETGRGFLLAGRRTSLTLRRSTLDGAPRPGVGTWTLWELRQPEQPQLPTVEETAGILTPDYGEDYSPEPRWPDEKSLADWPDAARVAAGRVRHGANGEARAALPPLEPGAYRLRYETQDEAGVRAEAQQVILVAGARTPLALPAVLALESPSVPVGGTARLLVHTGFPDQTCFFEIWRGGERLESRTLRAGESPSLLEIPIRAADRGGLVFKLLVVHDHQIADLTAQVLVPWDDRKLQVSFATFRDKLRPGARETWKVKVRAPAGAPPEAAAAEVLAAMSDRSLDLIAPFTVPDPLGLYPTQTWVPDMSTNLRGSGGWWRIAAGGGVTFGELTTQDGRVAQTVYVVGESSLMDERRVSMAATVRSVDGVVLIDMQALGSPSAYYDFDAFEEMQTTRDPWRALQQPRTVRVRSDFSETAFWLPQLLTGPDGTATIEFTVPDSVTSWRVWVQAVTRDLRSGTAVAEARSARDLLVRPYLPRFLREGDRASLKVVLTSAAKRKLQGEANLEIYDPESGQSLLADFGLTAGEARLPFTVEARSGASLTFSLSAPRRPGTVAFKVTAAAGDESDGELRPLPVLPSRVHLAQSRFAVLRDAERRELRFAGLDQDDPTRTLEQLVVTVDGQLFQGMLAALPYLVHYPYECTEQTLNRFLSTGILAKLFDRHPAVATLAADLAKRETRFETWDTADPNRKLALEEAPFLADAKGGGESDLLDVLDPRVAQAQHDESLAKLLKSQLASGAFPWWPGGAPSDYMTAYVLLGFARAAEFGVAVPREPVARGWSYLAGRYRDEQGKNLAESCCRETRILVNYVAAAYPDPAWMGNALTETERRRILDESFADWTSLCPYLKTLLAFTLNRMGRADDARLVFDSVMDRAKTTPEEGTFWQPEERSWLWYNDTVDSHAAALRVLMELRPDDPRRHGLVQWLFVHKQLNHWKSTRATAEVLYTLAHYLEKEGELGIPEKATVEAGGQTTTFTFEPDRYTGKENRLIVPGDKIDPAHSAVVVEKETPGFLIAAATLHFSTDEPVKEGNGDLFHVSRRYFLRLSKGGETVLKPLDEGTVLKAGDEVEVQLTLSSRSPAEYVHLRDPRPAGLEPETVRSGWRWDLGPWCYEEARDSGTNFFFESLPAGEHTFAYRLRASLAGEFRVGPATVQSMYAPEFTAYSAGNVVKIGD